MPTVVESNPLCHIFPVEISDLIFQHFTGTELLKASEVSPSFYSYVAGTKACMDKIKIKLSDRTMQDEEQKLLMGSDRKYKHLEVSKSSPLLEPAQQILASQGRKWSSVAIRAVNFKTIEDAYGFLRSIQSNVEKLVLKNVALASLPKQTSQPVDLTFSKLKIFETDYCQHLMNTQPFINCTNLTTLSIKSGVFMNSSKEGVQKMLQNNEKLTVLRLGQIVTKTILKEDISLSIQFKLKEFHIGSPYYEYSDRGNEDYKQNLNLFLKTQTETLERITIGEGTGDEVMQTIKSMPNLKNLIVKSLGHHYSPA